MQIEKGKVSLTKETIAKTEKYTGNFYRKKCMLKEFGSSGKKGLLSEVVVTQFQWAVCIIFVFM